MKCLEGEQKTSGREKGGGRSGEVGFPWGQLQCGILREALKLEANF